MTNEQDLLRFGKVICYVVVNDTVLAFTHRTAPEAGIQVPAGTIERDEEPAAAALRETVEETGRSQFEVVTALGECDYLFDFRPRLELHHRHFFLLRPTDTLPTRWSHFAEGQFWFDFYWMPIDQASTLGAAQGSMLKRVHEYL